jgi:hypothetical protein
MSRSRPLVVAALALGVLIALGSPATAQRARFDEQAGDVVTRDGDRASRAERRIDVVRPMRVETLRRGGRSMLRASLRARDLRDDGRQWLYLHTVESGEHTYLAANVDRSGARVADGDLVFDRTCRDASVRARLGRETARLSVPARCLGGGSQVGVVEVGTLHGRSLRPDFAAISAVDVNEPVDSPDGRILAYP